MSLIRINRHPSRRQLAVFGLLWLLCLGVVGWLALRGTGSLPIASAVWSAGVLVPAIGLAVPTFLRMVYVGMAYAAFPIGLVVSHVILAVAFYGVMTPTGLLMRLFRYDPLQRRLNKDASTYWIERKSNDDTQRYFKQY